jgi:hypothetical protein
LESPEAEMSISDILQQTLDLIGEESNSAPKQSFLNTAACQSASSILLEERRKIKQKQEEIEQTEFMGFSSSSGNVQGYSSTSLYQDIAESSVTTIPKHLAHKKKNLPLSVDRKVNFKNARGENYKDKLQNRQLAKINKNKLRNKLKHS